MEEEVLVELEVVTIVLVHEALVAAQEIASHTNTLAN